MGRAKTLREVFQRMVRYMLLAVIAVGTISCLIAYWLQSYKGIWAALMAVGIGAFVIVSTAAVGLATIKMPVDQVGMVLMAGWVIKVVVIGAMIMLVRGKTFYSPGVFIAVFLIMILLLLGIEFYILLTSRIPYVEIATENRKEN